MQPNTRPEGPRLVAPDHMVDLDLIMTRHYPLDQNLEFERYEHRPLGARDVMIHRVWDYFVIPQDLSAEVPQQQQRQDDNKSTGGYRRGPILDMQCLMKMLITDRVLNRSTRLSFEPMREEPPLTICTLQRGLPKWGPEHKALRPDDTLRIEDMAVDLAQRLLFEVSDPTTRLFVKHLRRDHYGSPDAKNAVIELQTPELLKHMKSCRPNAELHQNLFVFPGGFRAPTGVPTFPIPDLSLSLRNDMLKSWKAIEGRASDTRSARGFCTDSSNMLGLSCLSRGERTRAHSLLHSGSWTMANFYASTFEFYSQWIEDAKVLQFPALRISEIDKLVRRKSLSRSHIRNMFKEPPRGASLQASAEPPSKLAQPCTNCGVFTHFSNKCRAPCGYCGKAAHQAPKCPVKRSNRCKCRPFPAHIAARCRERCSRRCGNPHVPSHNNHINAMTCKSRCYMCGIRGHSGKECRFQRCQCGQKHLTQVCRWKVECPGKNCDRYLCRLHCAECGKKKDKKATFTGGRCQQCLADDLPVRPRVETLAS